MLLLHPEKEHARKEKGNAYMQVRDSLELKGINSLNYNHGWKSWDTFACVGLSLNRISPTPPPTPHTRLDACILSFSQDSTSYTVGWVRTARYSQNVCTVLLGHPEITENHEYCIPVPRTFVQDSRFKWQISYTLQISLCVWIYCYRTVVTEQLIFTPCKNQLSLTRCYNYHWHKQPGLWETKGQV